MSQKLRELRASKELSQEQLARAAGISLSALQKLEQGRVTDPATSITRRLARALATTMDHLAGEDEPTVKSRPARKGRPPKASQ